MTDLAALRELTLNRIRVMLREPEVLFWVFLFPILLAVGIGIAFGDGSTEVLRIAVERGSAAEPYLDAIRQGASLESVLMDPEPASAALRRGEITLVAGGDAGRAAVTLRFDPTRPEARTARIVTEAVLQAAAGGTRPLAVVEERTTERGHRYIDWLIPGLIGFNLMGTGLWSVGFYTTQARENRELRRLVATPMRRSDFLLAQLLARFAFLLVEIPLIIFFAWTIFGVTIEGGPLPLALIVLLGATCFTGLGLLAASRSRTTEGVGGLINLIMMPMLVLSGVFFSAQRFPEAAQPLIQALPLTALNDALRSVYNEGLGLGATLGDLGILALWTGGSFFLALRLFRWQ
jgi:ABC-type multidrug transport system permease subunit